MAQAESIAMEFAFTEEQLMIRDTAAAYLAQVSSSTAVRAAMESGQGYQPDVWRSLCSDLCWQLTHIPEQYGGMGLGYVELVAMLEQMGRFQFCSPFFSTVCLGVNALLLAGSAAQKHEYLPRIGNGMTATLAYTGASAGDGGGQWGASAVQVIAQPVAAGFVLDGTLRYVPDGATAELLIIAARAEQSSGADGISLFAVDARQAGINSIDLPTLDQTRRLAEIRLHQVRVPASALMGAEGEAWHALSRVIDLATIALAAEQMGGAQAVLDMAVKYSLERVQFGRPIGSFQAIKHKAADMMLRVEVARSGVYYAACIAQEALQQTAGDDTTLAAELPEAASVAKACCSDAFCKNAGDALQIHGGVGFTWEYDVHLYFKRAKASEHLLGNGAWHRERLAAMLLDAPAFLQKAPAFLQKAPAALHNDSAALQKAPAASLDTPAANGGTA